VLLQGRTSRVGDLSSRLESPFSPTVHQVCSLFEFPRTQRNYTPYEKHCGAPLGAPQPASKRPHPFKNVFVVESYPIADDPRQHPVPKGGREEGVTKITA
jgi:hypothetical protein